MEIISLKQLEDALQYYVIDTEVCLEKHYSFNDVITSLKKEIQSIELVQGHSQTSCLVKNMHYNK